MQLVITPQNLIDNGLIYILGGIFSLLLLYYFATVWQMCSYKLSRVLFHYPNKRSHLRGFVAPFALFMLLCASGSLVAVCALCIAYAAALFIWAKNLDKRLVFTARIKRLFGIALLLAIVLSAIHWHRKIDAHVLDIVIFSALLSALCEKILFKIYLQKAAEKISKSDAKIILITASFGKTSIKHFLAQLLGAKAHFAPGSINTLAGIAKDINDNLCTKNPEFYIVEAGARERGDIAAIAKLVRAHVVIIGEIGSAHLEYFKNIATTKSCKREALQSPRLEKAFLHQSAYEPGDFGVVYSEHISNVKATLEGISFELFGEKISANVLGSFNAQNIAAAFLCAKYLLGKAPNPARLAPVAHRLQVVLKSPKFIIDDGFNGNENGVLASYELVALYPGRKVLVTPGLIEISQEANRRIAARASEIFDVIIISARINALEFANECKKQQKANNFVILANKSELEFELANRTKEGDLILFSNDAPNHL